MFLSFLIALAGTALVVASAIWLGRLWKGGAHGVAKVLGTAGLLGLIYTGGYTAYLGGRLMAEDGTIAESSRPGDAEAGSLASGVTESATPSFEDADGAALPLGDGAAGVATASPAGSQASAQPEESAEVQPNAAGVTDALGR